LLLFGANSHERTEASGLMIAQTTDKPLVSPSATETAHLESGRLITAVHPDHAGVDVQALLACSPDRLLNILTNFEEMPRHIYGLERVEVLERAEDEAIVRFTMKLPFPVGRVRWTNQIRFRSIDQAHAIEWTLLDGDLRANAGRLVLTPHRGHEDRTYARYRVHVESRFALPKSAERLATRWLLPKIVNRLRRVAERDANLAQHRE
jgi:uncharacterized membrane protein